MIYANPNHEGSVLHFKGRYDNSIDGGWVAPVKGQYFDNISPASDSNSNSAAMIRSPCAR